MSAQQELTCPMCQATVPTGTACHVSCPLSAGSCGLVRCPRCGYEMPDPSRSWLASALQRFLVRASGQKGPIEGERP